MLYSVLFVVNNSNILYHIQIRKYYYFKWGEINILIFSVFQIQNTLLFKNANKEKTGTKKGGGDGVEIEI